MAHGRLPDFLSFVRASLEHLDLIILILMSKSRRTQARPLTSQTLNDLKPKNDKTIVVGTVDYGNARIESVVKVQQ